MKATFALILLLGSLHCWGQSRYLVESHLGYTYRYHDRLDAPAGLYGQIQQKLHATVSVGRRWNDSFYYGVGLAHTFSKQETNPTRSAPAFNPAPYGYSSWQGYTHSTLTHSELTPFAFVQYLTTLSECFSVVIGGQAGYVFQQQKLSSNARSAALHWVDSTGTWAFTDGEYWVASQANRSRQQAVQVRVVPALRCDLGKRAGIALQFASLAYRHKLRDSRAQHVGPASHEFQLNFKPEVWEVGGYVRF
ncbi:hypothetical protein SAMN05421823_113104 [Catalinimonas alkaloidigena]|uniref:Outer membrane protein beta-barrel domain-containing protein n=1 Tax=Catalinimonas alkaloidigena TaxID=1075417 RepID=A0A1G9T6M8_9BACT|nr:hypothetical protein [Catalinimonas alkaloidigena]SDM43374.1 hypothetical protein SAMN05421823_113104 [Catalinimonas alkaloidigena]